MAAYQAVISCLLMICVTIGAQQNSNGMYFRMVFMDNFVDYPVDRAVDLYVCNPQLRSTIVNVTIPYFRHSSCEVSQVASLFPSKCVRISLCGEIRHSHTDGSLARKVVDITSPDNVTVQGFNVEKFSADSYLVMPWNMMGRVYYIMCYTLQSIQTQFAIVTTREAKIRIVIPNRSMDTITIDYNGLRYTNGETLMFTLDPSHSFLAQSSGDLTGVMIQSDRSVGVFTGNVRTYNDFSKASRDHLVEQVPPVERWGKEFVYIPVPRLVVGDTLKFLSVKASYVTLIEDIAAKRTIQVLANTPYYLNATVQIHIRSEEPILVAVFVRSQDGKAAGESDPADPSMYFLPPTSLYSSSYFLPAFVDSGQKMYQKVWLLLAVGNNDDQELQGIRIDDKIPLPSTVTVLYNSDNYALKYAGRIVLVNSMTQHKVSHIAGKPFMAIGYGASDRESFASPLGYTFPKLDCESTDMRIDDGVDNDCDGRSDEEFCGNCVDDDDDGLVDEDCQSETTNVRGDATGRDFAIVFMSNVVRDVDEIRVDEVELYITAMEEETFFNITSPAYSTDGRSGGPTILNKAASTSTVYQVRLDSIMRLSTGKIIGRSIISDKVIKVQATKNIIIYGINKKQYSTDGFLSLPTIATGTSYFAFCYFPINTDDDRCQFAAVATMNNTTIYIDIPEGVTIEPLNGQTYVGPITPQVTLLAYTVVEIQSRDDLTGTRVYTKDGKAFSFFSGNVRARVPKSKTSRDHLVEQLPPAESWGRIFSTMPTPRDSPIGDVFKVIARDPATQVTYFYKEGAGHGANQKQVDFPLINSGSHHLIDLQRSQAMHIRATKPVLVIQISKSATSRDTDPAAIVVIPEELWSNNYRFVTPLTGQRDDEGNQLPFNNSVMVTVKREYRANLYFTHPDLNGTIEHIGSLPGWVAIPNSEHMGLVFNVKKGQGQSVISSKDKNATWMALAFGRADRETYGNAIGLQINHVASNNRCQSSNMEQGDQVDNDCDGRIDEEVLNGVDDDGDCNIDEDLGLPPMGYEYALVFQENMVEFPRNYALEIYVGVPLHENVKVFCTLETPSKTQSPTYKTTALVHDPELLGKYRDRIQFAVSGALRTYGSGKMQNGIKIMCNREVTVMAVNKETFSNDAFIIFEVNTLGVEYFSVSFAPATIATQFAVIAVKEGVTVINLILAASIKWGPNSYQYLNTTLEQYQVFQAQSKGDLTGSEIRSNKPVAVFSGNVRTKVDLSASRDHLASQLPPVTAYGKEFVLVPSDFRSVGDIYRVISQSANTHVTYGRKSFTLNRMAQYKQFDLVSSAVLIADKPVLVMQIMKSQNGAYSSEEGDPCFMLVPPVTQFVSVFTLVTPVYTKGFYRSGDNYQNFLTIITEHIDGIRINGKPITNYLSTRDIPNSNYASYNYKLTRRSPQTITLHHRNNATFSGYLVGLADRESYCVPIGPKLPRMHKN